ncbi:MAG: methylaspartate mutase [Proteobacteria bacterium]|nr:MAG: methylaspartate mutase [Pseudomonadota bacterium]
MEEPVADVTVGAMNAFSELQELSSREIISPQAAENQPPFISSSGQLSKGIDLYLSTSSAGGGLQMLVAGVVREMTAESAQRAALGAGAIVLDTLSADDGREDFERVERIRHLRPDIVLLSGGTDGGSESHVIEMAELLVAAAPRPRFGDTLLLPVIYAGNCEAAEEAGQILKRIAQVQVIENVRPSLERENLAPAREAIHEFFLSHVMSHSPGYSKLLSWSPVPIMPTPAAVGEMVLKFADRSGKQILCADIGGATTDVFSVFRNTEGQPVFNRTVSANLGMSYSMANVLVEAGVENIARWLSFDLGENELRDRLRNKMIRPTSIPQTLEDLWLEQAVCREALRLSLYHHRSLAVGLSGRQQERTIADIFSQRASRYELVDMGQLDLVIGSGGVLSHAPHRLSAALMMLDGFELRGLTQIAVDSIFMMPHLGVFGSIHPKAAEEIFLKDCLVNVAHAVVPVYPAKQKNAAKLAKVFADGKEIGQVSAGKVELCKVESGSRARVRLEPLASWVDLGAGAGKPLEREIETGQFGLILDGRNRPLQFPADRRERMNWQRSALENLGLI